jgi:hypothetical protein
MARVTRFMLDTNTASWLLKGQPNVVARLEAAATVATRMCGSVTQPS